MAKFSIDDIEPEIKGNVSQFLKKIKSDMAYKSNYSGDLLSFEWLDEIEYACPFLDNIIRNPKIALIQIENVEKIERSKRINVSSVKNLARHTEYINKYDKKTEDIEPNKILDIRNEETFNTYENRFLYTLYKQLVVFVMNKEEELKNFTVSDDRLLEYTSDTVTNEDKIHIEVKLTSESLPTNKVDKKIQDQIKSAKLRLKKVKDYLSSWEKSEIMKTLDGEHVPFVNPPIKKTNVILKNPNFAIAARLWEYLNSYGIDQEEDTKDNINSDGNELLKGFLDHSFLIDYFVLDSVTKSKREEKKRIAKRAMLLLEEEFERIISLLLSMGIDINEDELLAMVLKEMKNKKSDRLVGADDVKKKFKNAMEEYLERTQGYL